MLSMINRGRIADPAVVQEMEHLISRLRGFLSQSFDEDGQLIVADPNLAVMPVGGLAPYAGTTSPAGWLLCDGTQYSRTTYKSLFDVVGTTYGIGDGSTTFNIPDMRQKFPLGKAASGTGATLGSTGGTIDHTHATVAHTHTIPSHNHTVSLTTSADGDHSHTVASHTHTIPTEAANFTSIAVGWPANVNVAAGADYAVTPFTAGDHFHDVSAHSHGGVTGAAAPSTDTQGSHTHTASATTSTDGSGTTGSSGAGTTDAANSPYLSLNYIIFAGV